MTKYIIGALAVLVILGGAYEYYSHTQVSQSAGSTVGTTFNTAKVAEVIMSPTSAVATTTSIFNGDASDRIIDNAFVACNPGVGTVFAQTGAGVSAFTWTAATTSTNAPATLGSNAAGNYALNVNLATSTTNDSYIATSTYTNVIARRWAAGSYLTFSTNATSSTAGLNCQAGVYYHGS